MIRTKNDNNSPMTEFTRVAESWFGECRQLFTKNKYESVLNNLGFLFEKLPEQKVIDLSLKFLNEVNAEIKAMDIVIE